MIDYWGVCEVKMVGNVNLHFQKQKLHLMKTAINHLIYFLDQSPTIFRELLFSKLIVLLRILSRKTVGGLLYQSNIFLFCWLMMMLSMLHCIAIALMNIFLFIENVINTVNESFLGQLKLKSAGHSDF